MARLWRPAGRGRAPLRGWRREETPRAAEARLQAEGGHGAEDGSGPAALAEGEQRERGCEEERVHLDRECGREEECACGVGPARVRREKGKEQQHRLRLGSGGVEQQRLVETRAETGGVTGPSLKRRSR